MKYDPDKQTWTGTYRPFSTIKIKVSKGDKLVIAPIGTTLEI